MLTSHPSMSDDLPEYLAEGWDPESASVNELVSILSERGVDIPAKREKKQFYVDLFQSEVAAKRSKIAAKLEKIRMMSPAKMTPAKASVVSALNAQSRLRDESWAPASPSASKRKLKGATSFTDGSAAANAEDNGSSSASSSKATPNTVKSMKDDEEGRFSGTDDELRKSPGRVKKPRHKEDTTGSSLKNSEPIVLETDDEEEVPLVASTPRKRSSRSTKGKKSADVGAAESSTPAKPKPVSEFVSPQTFDFKVPTPKLKESESVERPAESSRIFEIPSSVTESSEPAPPFAHVSSTPRRKTTAAGELPAEKQTERRKTVAGTPMDQVKMSFNTNNTPGSPARFIDFQKLATPVKALPTNFVDLMGPTTPAPVSTTKKSEGTPARSKSPKRSPNRDSGRFEPDETLAWDSLLPAPKDSPAKETFVSAPQTPVGKPKLQQARKLATVVTRRQRRAKKLTPVAVVKYIISLALVTYVTIITVFWDRLSYRDRGTLPPRLGILENKDLDSLLSRLIPTTRECPEGAVCNGKAVLSCNSPDYILQRNAFATFGARYFTAETFQFLVPFGLADPICVQDTAKLRREARKQEQADSLFNYLEDIVRYWTGRVICGEVDPDLETTPQERSMARSTKTKEVLGMPISAGKRALRKIVGSKWTDDKFEEYWGMILLRLADPAANKSSDGEGGITTTVDESGKYRLLVARREPVFSISCSVRRNIWQQVMRHWLELLATGALLLGSTVYYLRSRAAARDAVIVGTLVEDVLDSLYAESENHRTDPTRHPVPGLSVPQLRDHFLSVAVSTGTAVPNLPNLSVPASPLEGAIPVLDSQGRTRWTLPDESTRDRIWKKTSTLVLRNACVRETTMEFRGDFHVVWQWIGSHALKPRPRKMVGEVSNRGGAVDDIPGAIFATTTPARQAFDKQQHQMSSDSSATLMEDDDSAPAPGPVYPTL
jgi:hypothetical protein